MIKKPSSSRHPGKFSMIATVCVACVLTACGGSGTDTVPSTVASRSSGSQSSSDDGSGSSNITAAKTTMVISRGPVNVLGTIGVNNVRYEDRAAVVRINGHERPYEDLRLGMVVEIEAERNEANLLSVARSITATSFAEGRVEALDPVARTITVMGAVITVPANTVFEGLSGLLDPSFKVGDFVEIYGLASTGTTAIATRIEKKTAGAVGTEDLSLTGTVRQIDPVLKTFVLAGTTIAYSNARIENVGAGLADGITVRIEGVPSGPGVITATEIEGASFSTSSREGFSVDQEGLISDYDPVTSTFRLNGVTVDASSARMDGILVNQARVKVNGSITNGVLLASRIERTDQADEEVRGEEVRVTGAIKLGIDSFQIGSITVKWDVQTRFDDVSPQTLQDNQVLEVRAVRSGEFYLATRIKLD